MKHAKKDEWVRALVKEIDDVTELGSVTHLHTVEDLREAGIDLETFPPATLTEWSAVSSEGFAQHVCSWSARMRTEGGRPLHHPPNAFQASAPVRPRRKATRLRIRVACRRRRRWTPDDGWEAATAARSAGVRAFFKGRAWVSSMQVMREAISMQ